MTMDYHNRYNACPEYYCPPYQTTRPYQATSYHYPHHAQMYNNSHQQQPVNIQQQPVRNFSNNVNGTTNYHHNQQSYFPPYHQHQQRPDYTIPYVPNFLVSSTTGLTPTLTPTTLVNLEQSFIELQSGRQNGARDPVTQSGFVPPIVDPGHSADVSQDSQDYSSDYSDSDWKPQAKRGRMLQDMRDVKNVDFIVTSSGTINATPQRKYTRRNNEEKLPPEEEERRRVRRERNKVAAAKCRQRRVDHTNELVEETEKLEAEQNQLESEIQSLQQERDQLEFILQAHQPLCKVDQSRHHLSKVKVEPGSRSSHMTSYSHMSRDTCPGPENLSRSATSVSSTAATNATTTSTSTSHPALESAVMSSRPNSLPLIKRDRARMLSLTSATGITINTPTSGVTITPSSVFCPGLDSMVDGSTGLTPLTGMSCSSQVQRNSSDSGSEAVGSPTLISL